MNQKNLKLAIIGLGYVGLPLALEFGRSRPVIGFDNNKDRIKELKEGYDRTNEFESLELLEATGLIYSCNINDLAECDCYIITVPTPIDIQKKPDLSSLISASTIVGEVLSKGNIVIYESTVYPGATEEVCAPVLSKKSGLTYASTKMPKGSNIFYLGYSPERINPGDKEKRITDILKVTSGSTPEVASLIDELYKTVIKAGTYKATSRRIAEAATVIENTQRDVNIALINELAIIFNRLNIDTKEVLKTAQTKWNFIPFQPGLVGGHCIGVDPYYLTYKAVHTGYNPEIILAGRRLNDNMPEYVAERFIKLMLRNNINILNAKILVLGLTFKENCSDTRNSKVFDMIKTLSSYKCNIDVYDPKVIEKHITSVLCGRLITLPETQKYDGIILAVKHDIFLDEGIISLRRYGTDNHVFFDLKYAFAKSDTDDQL